MAGPARARIPEYQPGRWEGHLHAGVEGREAPPPEITQAPGIRLRRRDRDSDNGEEAVKFGVYMFPTHYAIDVVSLGRALEERGFESLFLPEHTHIPTSRRSPWPGGAELPEEYKHTLDPFVALGAVAATTERLLVATGICLVVERDPISTAKEVASVDWISGGRFLFGVGAGWKPRRRRVGFEHERAGAVPARHEERGEDRLMHAAAQPRSGAATKRESRLTRERNGCCPPRRWPVDWLREAGREPAPPAGPPGRRPADRGPSTGRRSPRRRGERGGPPPPTAVPRRAAGRPGPSPRGAPRLGGVPVAGPGAAGSRPGRRRGAMEEHGQEHREEAGPAADMALSVAVYWRRTGKRRRIMKNTEMERHEAPTPERLVDHAWMVDCALILHHRESAADAAEGFATHALTLRAGVRLLVEELRAGTSWPRPALRARVEELILAEAAAVGDSACAYAD